MLSSLLEIAKLLLPPLLDIVRNIKYTAVAKATRTGDAEAVNKRLRRALFGIQ